MPSITHDPGRLPTRTEARSIAAQLKDRAEHDPDGTSDDYLASHLLLAFARGEVAPFGQEPGTPPDTSTAA